jgi:hypothetical protein
MQSNNWDDILNQSFSKFLSLNLDWYPKLNDQDVFNVINDYIYNYNI